MNFGGGGGNPPWARQSGSSAGYGYSAASPYSSQQTLGQPGLAMPTSLSAGSTATSSYSSRVSQQTSASSTAKQRVFTGSITKISENFGFVDEDVFFQTSVCKGGIPKLGDRVLVEASFNPNMPFKWNATRIQLLPSAAQGTAHAPQQMFQQQAAAAVQQLNALQQAQLSAQALNPVHNQGISPLQIHHIAAQQQSRSSYATPAASIPKLMQKTTSLAPRAELNTGGGNRSSRFDQRDRRDDRRNERPIERQRSPPPRRRSRSPPPRRRSRSPKVKSRSRSPKRKTTPRYSVNISPLSFDTESCSVVGVSKRYNSLYIPSDFFHLSLDWSKAFTLDSPLRLGNATRFHICHRDVDPLVPFPESVDPPDADYSYCAKVMLLAQPSMEDIYKQCCSLAENSKEGDFIHPTRVLQFLVGMRAKNEPLAIGGPWSPSLDGADPANDPRVLIKTAIRTTKALTGIDLSACTQWYRFVDISYLRAEEVHKGRTIPEHTEHVVMFLPDIWSVVPTMLDYLALQASYKHSLLIKLSPEEEKPKQDKQPVNPPTQSSAPAETKSSESSQSQDVTATKKAAVAEKDSIAKEATDVAMETGAVAKETPMDESGALTDEADTSVEVTEDAEGATQLEPSHWSKLDPKAMKVLELRTELEARGLSCKGLKSQLQTKLSKALKTEMEAEEKMEEETTPTTAAEQTIDTAKKEPQDTATIETTNTADTKEAPAATTASGETPVTAASMETSDSSAVEQAKIGASKNESGNENDSSEPVSKSSKDETAPEVPPVKELTKEEKEKKARDLERLRARLERCYVFPPEPVILVHPNRSAKSGKFDCSVMSLSVLLDYRPEDTKEHSFEVSLFAESFNEMLMRDFGFSIYKKLNSASIEKEKEDAAKRAEAKAEAAKLESKGSGDADSKDTTAEDNKKSTSTAEESKEDKTESKKREPEKLSEPEAKKRKRTEEDDEDDRSSLSSSITDRSDRPSQSSRKKGEADIHKVVTVDKAALLAFVYYDTSHVGYIVDKDLEDMFYTLGLQISRAQVRGLLQTLKVPQGRLNVVQYRKLTDKPEKSTNESEENVDLDVALLARGNLGKQSGAVGASVKSDAPENVVMFRGAVLELDKVMERLDKSEASRLNVEQEMRSLVEQNESLTKKLHTSEENVKKLTSDQRRLNERLNTTRSERNRKQEEASSLKMVLSTVGKDLHKIVKVVDERTRSEEREVKPAVAERYTPSRDSSTRECPPNGVHMSPAGSSAKQVKAEDFAVKEEPASEKVEPAVAVGTEASA